jgi:phage tail-like protein
MALADDILYLLSQVLQQLDFSCRRTLGSAAQEINHSVELGWSFGDSLITEFLDANPTASITRDRVFIQRAGKGYPYTINQGDVIYDSDTDGDLETIEDVNPIYGEVNYYTIFYQVTVTISGSPMEGYPAQFYLNNINYPGLIYDPKWLISQFNTKKLMAVPFEFADKFYSPNFLPEIYREKDKDVDPAYFLRSYFTIAGRSFEDAWSFVEELFAFWDPMKCDDDLMQNLAWNIGWIVNKELPLPKQRLEIRRAVRTYKRKGTEAGLIAFIEGLSGWNAYIVKGIQNVLYTNELDSTTIGVSDPDIINGMGTLEDTVDYILGGNYAGYSIIVVIEATEDWDLFNQVREKIVRIVQDWVPICCSAAILLSTPAVSEDFTMTDEDISYDLISDNWLLTDVADRLLDDLAWRAQ